VSDYTCTIHWQRQPTEAFTDQRYSRGHSWTFDGGCVVPASSSPHSVPVPFSLEANVDPEEAFVAALASCHMLFFLHLAAQQGLVVENYTDRAVGLMARDASGRLSMTEVTLNPVAGFRDAQPTLTEIAEWHETAHDRCFIARSVKTAVRTELSGQRTAIAGISG
jgi:organic hydroperoxide reductase OsmC/OhrA